MADCEETLRELQNFLDGELPRDELEHVRHHIDGCMDCLQVYDFYAELRTVIRARCQERQVPPGLMQRIVECFGSEEAAGGGASTAPSA